MKTITFKVTDEEARRIRQQARRERLSVSEFLRRRAAGAAAPDIEISRTTCEFTGAKILGPMEGSAPLTTEAAKEILADFP